MNLKKYKTLSEPQTPDPEGLKAIEEAIEQIVPQANIESWFKNYAQNHKARLAFDFLNVRSSLNANEPILECGAAPFILSVALHQFKHDVTALDIAPDRFSETIQRTGIKTVECDIEAGPLPFESESFGCVLFNQLFEHLRMNPIETMREVYRVLKPNGFLYLSTPNLRSLRGILNFMKNHTAFSCEQGVFEQYQKLETLGHMGHVREYTAAEVCDFLEKVGFQIKTVTFRGKVQTKLVALVYRFFYTYRPQMCIIATR